MAARERLELRVTGVVQGIGFRPFVYQLAQQHGLSGFVGNDNRGVFIEVEGAPDALAQFQLALIQQPPPLAHIETLTARELPNHHDQQFTIVESLKQPNAATLVSPDLCICDDCLRELFDPSDRRYRYPLINCTQCGPRYTIIRDLPYDRPLTTMRDFAMCPSCAAEYHDPLNRRFHAQPTACPDCGPKVTFVGKGMSADGDPIRAAQAVLRTGGIVAVKGLGGFHLACDATNDAAVARLRVRKNRPDKPFAVMVTDLAAAAQIADVTTGEAALLTSRERPIVLLRKRHVSDRITGAGNPLVGVMLPYTALHVLLLENLPSLVMTSGNLSGTPIITDNGEALTTLAPIADAFLLHDRAIQTPCDDSVVRVIDSAPTLVRRSRGYAPLPIALPFAVPPLLGVGGELKNALCLADRQRAFMSQHIGDMQNIETLSAFETAFDHLRKLFRIAPECIACDLHPNYLSTRWAQTYAQAHDLPLLLVQHHHAHIAALMAEQQLLSDAQVIGVCFDGTGYGTDGAIWGGEVLLAGYAGFDRAAHLAYVPLAGGDLSVKKPYRMALAHLYAAGIAWDDDLPPVRVCPPPEQRILCQQLEQGINTVPTSSMGRLFDAVAALIGLRQMVSYEAQAAIALEGAATTLSESPYRFEQRGDIIDPAPLLRAIITDLRAGVSPAVIAGRFHAATADLVVTTAIRWRAQTGINQVALSGGVFQNALLLSLCKVKLTAQGFDLLTHGRVPPNDGGIALGQIAIAAHQRR